MFSNKNSNTRTKSRPQDHKLRTDLSRNFDYVYLKIYVTHMFKKLQVYLKKIKMQTYTELFSLFMKIIS